MQLDAGFGALSAVIDLLVYQKKGTVYVLPKIHRDWKELDFDGIAVLSDKAVTTEIFLNQLVQIPVKGFHIPRKLRFALHQGQPSHLVELFINHLNQYNF